MANPIDKNAFLSVFKAEAEEYLAKLNQGILELEKKPDQPEMIHELFRFAHTLKGSARMMGFSSIQETAHRLEDLFEKIKNQQLKFSSSVADTVLKMLDEISSNLRQTFSPQASPAGSSTVSGFTDTPSTPFSQKLEEHVRIPIGRVDELMRLVGELVIHKVKSSYKIVTWRRLVELMKTSQHHLLQLSEEFYQGMTTRALDQKTILSLMHQCQLDTEYLKREISELAESLSSEAIHLDPIIDELQFKMKELRMLPCETIFEGLPRLVRDVAKTEGKIVELQISGEKTELDKKVLDALKPCLIHLLRNAVSHGIESPEERLKQSKAESGTIHLKASQDGGRVVIETADDGRGIDLEKIKQVAIQRKIVTAEELQVMDPEQTTNLIFAPGFSTSSMITDISGRGVGLDVVRSGIEELKGTIRIVSNLHQGTVFSIELPLTVAVMDILLVEVQGMRFGFPLLSVEEIVEVDFREKQTVNGRMVVPLRGRGMPVSHLAEILELPEKNEAVKKESKVVRAQWPVVVGRSIEQKVGFQVDQILGQEQIFIKSISGITKKIKNVSGATILGTGEVVIILDVPELVLSAKSSRRVSERSKPSVTTQASEHRILIVEDSLTIRELEKGILEADGYKVETAVDGLDALEKIAKGRFDLVISDIEMPRMNGFEFCKSLRQQSKYQDLPVIFVTTLSKDEEKRKGIEVGAQAYIVKGAFDQNHLLQTIKLLIC